jgi:hypothetical protein
MLWPWAICYNFGLDFAQKRLCIKLDKRTGWATFWATFWRPLGDFSQKHPVTLLGTRWVRLGEESSRRREEICRGTDSWLRLAANCVECNVDRSYSNYRPRLPEGIFSNQKRWMYLMSTGHIQVTDHGCQMVYFQTKKKTFRVNFGGSCNGRCWYIYFMGIWYILRPIGKFYGNLICTFYAQLVNLMAIW